MIPQCDYKIFSYSLFPGVIPKKFPNDGLVVQGAGHQSEGAGSIPIMSICEITVVEA